MIHELIEHAQHVWEPYHMLRKVIYILNIYLKIYYHHSKSFFCIKY